MKRITRALAHKGFLRTFTRHQLASALATLLDYLCLFFMTEALLIHYTLSTAMGALVGACSNFLLNRYWAFEAQSENWTSQSFRYILVSSGSLLLNTIGVFLVTELLHVHYATSVVIVSLLIGVCFNYPLHKNFVYPAAEAQPKPLPQLPPSDLSRITDPAQADFHQPSLSIRS